MIFKFYLFTHFVYFRFLYKKGDSRIPLGEKARNCFKTSVQTFSLLHRFSEVLFFFGSYVSIHNKCGTFCYTGVVASHFSVPSPLIHSLDPLFHRQHQYQASNPLQHTFLWLVRFVSYGQALTVLSLVKRHLRA